LAQAPLFITSQTTPHPSDAVAAIIVDAQGRYLVQHRDELPGIFYPGHWGCFGGALNSGEEPMHALVRELREELELDLSPKHARPFTRFDFDFQPLGLGKVFRQYYELQITDAQRAGIRLHEGQDLGWFDGGDLLQRPRVTPYDAFAIWMHLRSREAR
jgi:8-oxo-dGTP pyrophosphatase MutT (NUDIX family)